MSKDRGAFESDTLHRLCVEAARYWVIESYLRTGKLPATETRYAYSGGPHDIGWGNAPGPDDPELKPLRYKRVKITLTVEDTV